MKRIAGLARRALRRRQSISTVLVLVSLAGAAAQQPAELIIRNGLVVTAVGRVDADLRIRSGTIAEIGRNLTAAADARQIDAKGMLVLPGGIDPHTHLLQTHEGADNYITASAAALAGGNTTIANFISRPSGEDLVATLERAAAVIGKQAIADVFLHIMVGDVTRWTPTDLTTMAERGFTSVKFFLSQPAFNPNAARFLTFTREASAAGLLTMIHCEDEAILSTTAQRMMAEGRGGLHGQNFPDSRPVVAEEVATQRAVAMSGVTRAPVYFVHMSSERALRAAEVGMTRGLPVFVETRILYLHLTKDRYDQPDGPIYTGDPPLRERRDVDALWKGIAKGTVHVVATDHHSYTRAMKLDPSLTIVNHRPAGNYLQANLPLLYSQGVRTGRITLEQFVASPQRTPRNCLGCILARGRSRSVPTRTS